MKRLKWRYFIAFFSMMAILFIGGAIYILSNIQFCTLMGGLAPEGLSIKLTSEMPNIYDIEMWYPNDGHVKFRCENNQLVMDSASIFSDKDKQKDIGEAFTDICQNQFVSSDDTPSELTLKITWATGSYEETLRPNYKITQPNGEGCPPTYRSAYLEVEVQ